MMQEGRDWDRLVINRKDTTGEERVIGHTQIRKGGIAKVTGTAQYGSDVDLPGQLYAAVARSPYPHARILQINTQEAAALSGVRAVITGADCPTLFGLRTSPSWPGGRSATRGSRWPPWRLTPRKSHGRPQG